jgi:hypothetical protein
MVYQDQKIQAVHQVVVVLVEQIQAVVAEVAVTEELLVLNLLMLVVQVDQV